MNLLLDIGNTRVKWALSDAGTLHVGDAYVHEELSETLLTTAWQSLPDIRQMMVARVGPASSAALAVAVAARLWPKASVHFAQSQPQALGVRNGYQLPQQLGVDRWLALLAGYRHYSAPLLIADCGTALTLDLLAADGQHLGGYICPGLRLMKQALAHGTQALPLMNDSFAATPARHTTAAIEAGTLLAATGLIHQVAATWNFPVLLTGGDAARIAAELPQVVQIDDGLVLRGLALLTG